MWESTIGDPITYTDPSGNDHDVYCQIGYRCIQDICYPCAISTYYTYTDKVECKTYEDGYRCASTHETGTS